MLHLSGNQKISENIQKNTNKKQKVTKPNNKPQKKKPKIQMKEKKETNGARVLCIFVVSLWFLLFFFLGNSGIPNLHFSSGKKNKKETKKNQKERNCDRVVCIFLFFGFPMNAVWQRHAKGDKNGQMHCWKQSDFSMCPMLFPYLPICSYLFPYSPIFVLLCFSVCYESQPIG